MRSQRPRLFPALLKHWRGQRGFSQLDLGLAAGVSARHVSFLETGRSQPSREMVLRLANVLAIPLRDQNELLRAADFEAAFPEPPAHESFSSVIEMTIARMLEKHEPFPMLVMNRRYDVVRANKAAMKLVEVLLPHGMPNPPLNVFELLFDPKMARPFVLDWEGVARVLLSRLQRESLARGSDGELSDLLATLLAYPGVPSEWQSPDLSLRSDPCLFVRFRAGETELAFLVTVTVFDAPQNVTLEELRLESYFPVDEATARACETLSGPT